MDLIDREAVGMGNWKGFLACCKGSAESAHAGERAD